MAERTRKTSFESPITGNAEGASPEDAKKVSEALSNASAKFFESLRASGVKPVTEGEGYDRGSCGHDRS